MNGQNWIGITFGIIFTVAFVVSGIVSQSLGQFVEVSFALSFTLTAVVGAVGSVLEKDFFSAVVISGATIYWFIPMTIESLNL